MKANRRRDTRPELRFRRSLHALGMRFIVDAPVPGTSRRRRADVLLRGPRIAIYVDGCFWHSCPEHQHLPRANREWWKRKFSSIMQRDYDTDVAVLAAGWVPVRIWEHEDPDDAAARVHSLATSAMRSRSSQARGRRATPASLIEPQQVWEAGSRGDSPRPLRSVGPRGVSAEEDTS
jgi:DNA mismatch endonuclease (patch repair protein)